MIVRSAPLVGCVSQQEMVCSTVRSKGPPQSANDDVEEDVLGFDIGIAFLYIKQSHRYDAKIRRTSRTAPRVYMRKPQRREGGGIRISYFLRAPNVGDLINPSLIRALTGEHTCHIRQLEEPHLLAIGSIMARAVPLSQVWGSGVMHPDMGIGGAVKANIHALRGALSYAALRRGGIAQTTSRSATRVFLRLPSWAWFAVRPRDLNSELSAIRSVDKIPSCRAWWRRMAWRI